MYAGLMDAQICVGVCDGWLRPHFDEDCPQPLRCLVENCWAQDPANRFELDLLTTLSHTRLEIAMPA